MGNKGKRFELDVKNDINEDTHEWVKAHRPDFSGNSVGEVADIMVVWEQCSSPQVRHVVYGELKKRGGVDEGNRKVVMSGSAKEQSGMQELEELIEESPPWTDAYVGVKFPNRELIVLGAEELHEFLMFGDGHDNPDPNRAKKFHGARLTRGNNISMIKPELSWWPSSTAGEDDHVKFAKSIGLDEYDMDQ